MELTIEDAKFCISYIHDPSRTTIFIWSHLDDILWAQK